MKSLTFCPGKEFHATKPKTKHKLEMSKKIIVLKPESATSDNKKKLVSKQIPVKNGFIFDFVVFILLDILNLCTCICLFIAFVVRNSLPERE